ncbi:MAG: DUF484 family protein [Pseudomonadota bacterium]
MTTTNDVLSWLADHPDLLIEHPELIDQLNLPHDVGTTSLIEHQVERLRAANRKLEQRLTALTSIASENEQLIKRLHRLSLELMTQATVQAAIKVLGTQLREDFSTDAVVLHLSQPLPADGSHQDQALNDVLVHQDWPDTLAGLRDRGDIECGRLTREKLAALFGQDAAEPLKSVAVVPLEGLGLLAIGSTDQERFHPGMGTLFLELLGETLIARFAEDTAPQRKRA